MKIVDSGFRIDATGLVARAEVKLELGSAFSSGLGFDARVFLALNTTGRSVTLGSSTVAPGFLLRVEGSIRLVGVQGTGFLEIGASPTGFTMAFGLGFEIGGLQFRADGGAGVYSDGFALRLSVHAAADAPVFSIEADGTIQVNTTGHAVTLGNATVANGFLLDLQGKVSLLKVLNLDAHLTVKIDSAGWQLDATRVGELLRHRVAVRHRRCSRATATSTSSSTAA